MELNKSDFSTKFSPGDDVCFCWRGRQLAGTVCEILKPGGLTARVELGRSYLVVPLNILRHKKPSVSIQPTEGTQQHKESLEPE